MEPIIIDKAIREFIENIDAKPATKSTYKRVMIVFGKWLFLNKLKYFQIKPRDIISFKESISTKNQPRTVNLYLVVINKFYLYLEDAGICSIKIPKLKKQPVKKGFKRLPLTVEQVQKMLSTIDTSTEIGLRDFTLISLMVNTGLRRGEVSLIDTSDIFKRESIRGLMVQRKGHFIKDQHKVISENIYKLLIALAGESINKFEEPVFKTCTPGMEKRRLSPFQISQVVKKHINRIGLTDKLYSAHSLRHTTAVVMCMQGKDIYTICQYLGHSSVSTTQLYIQMVKDLRSWNTEDADMLSNLFQNKNKTEGNAS